MGKGRLDFNRPYLCGRLYVLINLQRGQACFCTFLIYQPCHLGSKGKLGFIILRSIISRISARFFLVGIVLARFVLIRLLIRLLIRFALVRLIGFPAYSDPACRYRLSRIRLAAVRLSCILIAAGVPGNVSQGGMITGQSPHCRAKGISQAVHLILDILRAAALNNYHIFIGSVLYSTAVSSCMCG